jgi:uncharacterized protein (TIGR04255 family)
VSLKKPPLVEVWISFRFEPGIDAPPWSRERYTSFLQALGSRYPQTQEMTRRAIRVTATRPSRPPRIKDVVEEVLAVRALTDDGLRAVQLAPDELVVNYLHSPSVAYPGFPSLLTEAMEHCARYRECYPSSGVKQVALHYVDLIDIPVPEDRVLRSEDFFNLNIQVPPQEFGGILAFELRLACRPTTGHDSVELLFATEATQPDESVRRFRMEWRTATQADRIMSEEEIRGGLQAAHDRLEHCFRSAFTPAGWALFEPENS